MPTRCNRGFYCRSYCLLNMFQAPLCPSSGAQEYYTVIAACGISCCGFQVAGLECSWGLCVRFAGCCSIRCIILLSSWWWAQLCLKHAEQGIRSAIKTSVASSWHFISTENSKLCGSTIFGVRATHTKYCAATSPHWLFTFLTNFKVSDFNKEHTSSLKMIQMMIKTCWSIFKCF